MNNSTKTQLIHFIKEAKTVEGLCNLEDRSYRISEGKVPEEINIELRIKLKELENEHNGNG